MSRTDKSELARALGRHGEALGRLWQARIELVLLGWDRSLTKARRREAAADGAKREGVDQCCRAVERSLLRMSRFVPGSTCIHRSLAGQRMLLRRGMAARIAIGLRRGEEEIEGHAWIEVDRRGQSLRLFWGEDAGYQPVW